MKIEISNGELIDKVTILLIKQCNIHDPQKLKNVTKELDLLWPLANELLQKYDLHDLMKDLHQVNQSLWDIEDHLRLLESERRFDEEFVGYARLVYINNDKRAAIKRDINAKSQSALIEEKGYVRY